MRSFADFANGVVRAYLRADITIACRTLNGANEYNFRTNMQPIFHVSCPSHGKPPQLFRRAPAWRVVAELFLRDWIKYLRLPRVEPVSAHGYG